MPHPNNGATTEPRYVRTKDFARIFGFSRAYAQQVIARGEISVVRMGPTMLLIPVEAIEQYARRLNERHTLPETAADEPAAPKTRRAVKRK